MKLFPKRRREYAECERQLLKKISTEYAIFKYKMLSSSVHEVYEACRHICFCECVNEYFLYCEHIHCEFVKAAGAREDILDELWTIYLKHEYLWADTWEDIEEILNLYATEHMGKSVTEA